MENQYNPLTTGNSKHKTATYFELDHAITLKPEELELLITATQQGDPTASRRLYDGFVLLLYDLSNEPIVRGKLGEDALSIACEEFYKLVNSYQGPDYHLFPGIVRKVVRSRLFRAINKLERQQETMESYEQRLDHGMDLPDLTNELEKLMQQETCRAAIDQLPPDERLILYRHFYLDIPLSVQANMMGISLSSLKRKYYRALKALKNNTAQDSLTLS